MKLEIPGQLRGSNVRKVMPVAIRLQKQYADQISVLDSADIDTVSPILRVGGKLGTFGDDAIENVRIGNRTAECDLVLAPRNWSEMTEAEIEHLVKPKLLTALRQLLRAAGVKDSTEFLKEAEQCGGEVRD